MSLFRQGGRKTWQARVWSPRLKKVVSISTKTDNRDKAAAIASQLVLAAKGYITDTKRLVNAIEAITGRPLEKSGISLLLAWDVYLTTPNLRISATQSRKRRRNWEKFMAWLADNCPSATALNDITYDLATRWVVSLQSLGVRGKTCNNMRGDVAAVFSALWQRAGMNCSPFAGVRQVPEDDSVSGRAFSPAEVSRILGVVSGEWRGAVLVGLYTGLRWGDVATLKWASVQDKWIAITPSKTARHKIRLKIPLHLALRQWLETQDRSGEWVFPGLCRRYLHNRAYHEFSEILEQAGVKSLNGEKIGFQSLRHTLNTNLASANVPVAIRQRITGHSTIEMNQHYNHSETELERAIAALE